MNGQQGISFHVREDFYDAELRSTYVAGLTYTIRPRAPDPSNPEDRGTPANETMLYRKVQEWIAAGKASLGHPGEGKPMQADAKIRGVGTVS